jgi:hypothetical protein
MTTAPPRTPYHTKERLFALAVMLSLAKFTVALAQTATPDSENGRYTFSPVADGVLRLDTRTGQVSQCSRSDAGWVCKAVPDERSALEGEITRLQGENATLKNELWGGGCRYPACRVHQALAPPNRRSSCRAMPRSTR